jgi:hypothetical protein
MYVSILRLLVGWFVGWLVCWLVGWLVGWLVADLVLRMFAKVRPFGKSRSLGRTVNEFDDTQLIHSWLFIPVQPVGWGIRRGEHKVVVRVDTKVPIISCEHCSIVGLFVNNPFVQYGSTISSWTLTGPLCLAFSNVCLALSSLGLS